MNVRPGLTLLAFFSMLISTRSLRWSPVSAVLNRWVSRPFSSLPSGNGSGCEGEQSSTQWDLKTLRIEVTKQCGKTLKKIVKASEVDERKRADPASRVDVAGLQERLARFNDIDARLKTITKSDDAQFKSILATLLEMGIDRNPPPQPAKIKKIKAPASGPRKPYNVFSSEEGIEIWVGKRAADNDQLSCDPQYRHNDEWWLHAAGCAGSHVVIKSTDNDLPTKYRDTLFDAAVLASHHSKAAAIGRPAVTLTRCRNVSKPKGFVDGMVQLQGETFRIEVNMKHERSRLERLLKQKNV